MQPEKSELLSNQADIRNVLRNQQQPFGTIEIIAEEATI